MVLYSARHLDYLLFNEGHESLLVLERWHCAYSVVDPLAVTKCFGQALALLVGVPELKVVDDAQVVDLKEKAVILQFHQAHHFRHVYHIQKTDLALEAKGR